MAAIPSYTELLNRVWSNVSAATGLTNQSESGFAYNIVAATVQELMGLWNEIDYLDTQGKLSTATGSNLDSIGAFFGVIRNNPTTATTQGTSSSVTFTNNGPNTVQIPANTRVWNSSIPGVSYYTGAPIEVLSGQSVSVQAAAGAPGSYYNVGAGALNMSSMYGSAVTVTNPLPISNGSDLESDANYRVRISNAVFQREGPNLTAIRSFLLQIPGVRDVVITNLARGTGTLDVMVYGYTPQISTSVASQCQAVLNTVVAAGVSAVVRTPQLIYVDVSAQVVITQAGVPGTVRTNVTAAIQSYINNLPIEDGSGNGTLRYSALLSAIQTADPSILGSAYSMVVNGLPSIATDQTLMVGNEFVPRTISVSVSS